MMTLEVVTLMTTEVSCARCGKILDIVGQWEAPQETATQIGDRQWKEATTVEIERMKADDDLHDYKPLPVKSERIVKARYVPSDYAGAHLRDLNTPDDRRPRVDLRTDAQIARERAVKRLRQHKLSRWGQADAVDWEDTQEGGG